MLTVDPGRIYDHGMDSKGIEKVALWFKRIFVNAQRAAVLAGELNDNDLQESNHLFWALAKYTENVMESITQLDNLNGTILPRLIEIPVEPESAGEAAWKDLKRMRNRLSHQFWNINPEVLRSTATEDLPKLISLISTFRIVLRPIKVCDDPQTVTIATRDLAVLPDVGPLGKAEPGNSLLFL